MDKNVTPKGKSRGRDGGGWGGVRKTLKKEAPWDDGAAARAGGEPGVGDRASTLSVAKEKVRLPRGLGMGSACKRRRRGRKASMAGERKASSGPLRGKVEAGRHSKYIRSHTQWRTSR